MARTFIRYFIEAQDDTDGAARSISERFTDLTRNLAAGFAAVGAALVEGVVEATERAESVIQRLIQVQGSVEDQPLIRELLRSGVSEEDATEAIRALRGPGADLGITGAGAAASLAGLSAAGANPTSALQAAVGFGVGGDSALDQLALAVATAQTSGQDAGELIDAAREYGPVLAELGLSFLESIQFISDLRRAGVTISRVSPALNQFIRRASAQGVDARAAATAAFEAVRTAPEEQGQAVAQELFGAEGGLRLARGIRTGQIGLGEQLRIEDELLNQASLAALNAPTSAELIDRGATALTLSDSRLHQVLGGLGGAAAGAPIVGGVLSTAGGQFLQGPGEGTTLGQSLGVLAEAGNANAQLETLIEINRAQLDAALLNPQAPDFAERVIQAANTDRGRLAD